MKKLIMIAALLFTVLPTFAEVGQQDHTECSAISSAKDGAGTVQPASDQTSGASATRG